MSKEELFKSLKEIKLSKSHYEGYDEWGGIFISGIVTDKEEGLIEHEEAQFILLCLNNRDMILNTLEDDLMKE